MVQKTVSIGLSVLFTAVSISLPTTTRVVNIHENSTAFQPSSLLSKPVACRARAVELNVTSALAMTLSHWFSFIDTTKSPWSEFTELMKKSIDIWTPTNYMVKRMERILGLKHYVIEACSVLEECMDKPRNDGYVIQASRRDERYKNFVFFERACDELNIPYVSCHPKKYNRKTYINILRRCRILVDACTEDSNTSLSTIEASFFKKPILISDIEVHKEGWDKGQVILFKNNDFADFKSKLRKLYDGDIQADTDGAFNSAIKRYIPKVMAKNIHNRLKEIL